MSEHVLVVDDDDAARQLLIELLKERFDLRIDSARDGADALHFIRQRPYRMVILDVMMPHMTGIDFLDSLQILEADSVHDALRVPPPVIVVTSASHEQIPSHDIEQRFPRFVRAVLRKPLQPEQLGECLKRWL